MNIIGIHFIQLISMKIVKYEKTREITPYDHNNKIKPY